MQTIIEEFEQQLVPKYRNYYVSFKQLLESIDFLHKKEESSDISSSALLRSLILPKDFAFGDTTAIFGLVEHRPEVRFVSILQHEVSKINHFCSLEVKTILTTLRQLERRLARIMKSDEMDASISRRAFPSAAEEAELAMTAEQKLTAIHEKLMSLSDEILILEHYVKLNLVILKRVTEEFDKVFSPPIGTWFIPNLTNEPFENVPFKGLFAVVSHLLTQTGRSLVLDSVSGGSTESAYSISPNSTLRILLLLSSLTDLQKPDGLWTSFQAPVRSEDLSHESMRSSALITRIVLDEQPAGIVSVTIQPLVESIVVEMSDGTKRSIDLNDELLLSLPPSLASAAVYEETRFTRARVLENIRVRRSGIFAFRQMMGAVSDEGRIDVERGFLVDERPSEKYSRSSSNIVLISSEFIQSKLSEFLTPIRSPFPLNELKNLPAVAETEGPSLIPPRLAPSPVMINVGNPNLASASSSIGSKKASLSFVEPRMAPKMIYPKNYMANERSFLAWISATTVQSGIGLALLGKQGLSFVGAVLCLVSLFFLWWAVCTFVKRFRQIREPKNENAVVFYSMEQCTVFGLVQLLLLSVQSVVFMWNS